MQPRLALNSLSNWISDLELIFLSPPLITGIAGVYPYTTKPGSFYVCAGSWCPNVPYFYVLLRLQLGWSSWVWLEWGRCEY